MKVGENERRPRALARWLGPGETVLWCGAPSPGEVVRRRFVGVIVGLLWLGGVIALFAMGALVAEGVLQVVLVLILVATCCGFVWVASAPARTFREARRTTYAVTDRRAITLVGHRRVALRSFYRRGTSLPIVSTDRRGIGDVVFTQDSIQGSEHTELRDVGFLAATDPSRVAVLAWSVLRPAGAAPRMRYRDGTEASRRFEPYRPESLLLPGETVVWTGRPALRFALPRSAKAFALGAVLLFTAVLALFEVVARGASPTLWAVAAIFVLVGAVALCVPSRTALVARETTYVMTNERVIAVRSGRSPTTESFPYAEIRSVELRLRGENAGDLVLHGVTRSNASAFRYLGEPGLSGVREIGRPYSLLHEFLARGALETTSRG